MAFLKVAMLKLLFEFDVVTFAQEIMSVQGQLTLSTYDVRLTFESGVVTKIQPISDVKLTSDACWGRVFHKCRQS